MYPIILHCKLLMMCVWIIKIDFQEDARLFFEMSSQRNEVELTYEIGQLMRRLWMDKGVQHCFSRSREYQGPYSIESKQFS